MPPMLLMAVSVGASIAVIIRGYILTKSFMLDKFISVSLFQFLTKPHSTTISPHHTGKELRVRERMQLPQEYLAVRAKVNM